MASQAAHGAGDGALRRRSCILGRIFWPALKRYSQGRGPVPFYPSHSREVSVFIYLFTSTEKRLRVADVRVKCQKNAPGITIDPVDKAPQSRRSGAGVEASIDASTVALQRPKTGA